MSCTDEAYLLLRSQYAVEGTVPAAFGAGILYCNFLRQVELYRNSAISRIFRLILTVHTVLTFGLAITEITLTRTERTDESYGGWTFFQIIFHMSCACTFYLEYTRMKSLLGRNRIRFAIILLLIGAAVAALLAKGFFYLAISIKYGGMQNFRKMFFSTTEFTYWLQLEIVGKSIVSGTRTVIDLHYLHWICTTKLDKNSPIWKQIEPARVINLAAAVIICIISIAGMADYMRNMNANLFFNLTYVTESLSMSVLVDFFVYDLSVARTGKTVMQQSMQAPTTAIKSITSGSGLKSDGQSPTSVTPTNLSAARVLQV
ncbi:hypothetical protein DFS34DRAFT_596004 [Phlyctochytrium arcticum]|nr:hypothetical protein DFS34DRAFT_596004 [Phlyctochytrium arcticum]